MSDTQISDAGPDNGPDGGQVLYNLAMGAQPGDFPPALQPLAQGYGVLFQPQPARTPGLLGSPDDIQAAIAQAAPVSAPAPTASDDDAGGDASAADGDGDDDQDEDDDDDRDQDEGDPSVHPAAAPDPVQRLTDAQSAAIANPRYRPPDKEGGPTHCNQATYNIAQRTGVNAAPLGDGEAYPANTQVRNLQTAAKTSGSGWEKIDLSEAQSYANQGKTTILGWIDPQGGHGHTATVMPDTHGQAANPTLAQVGGRNPGNGKHTFRQSFGTTKRPAVEAYVYVGR